MAFKYLVPIVDIDEDYFDEIICVRHHEDTIDITELTPEQRQGVTIFIDKLQTKGWTRIIEYFPLGSRLL